MQKPERKKRSIGKTKTLQRGLEVLETVCRSPDGLTQSELARRLGFDRSTALRFLTTLEQESYLWRNESGRYHATMKLAEMGRGVIEHQEICRHARDSLRRLTETTGFSSHVAVLSGNRVVYLDGQHGPGMIRVNTGPGVTAPLHCSATGKAIMAFLEARDGGAFPTLNGLVPGKLPSYTANTITAPGALKKEFARIRRQGYAVDNEEYEPGVRCLAAPVFEHNNRVAAVIGISGTAARVTFEKLPLLAQQICGEADQISRALGCIRPRHNKEGICK